MAVENESIGKHNGMISSVQLHERHNGRIETLGDISRKFIAGSVAKLYLASAALAISREGDFDLQEKRHISLGEFVEGNYGTGELRFTNLPLALCLHLLRAAQEHSVTLRPIKNRRLLELMVSKSDNLATLAVVKTLGREQVQQVLTFWGMKETTLYNPQIGAKNQTTADDIGYFLHNLSTGTLIPQDEVEAIKRWMQRQNRKNVELQPIVVRYKEGKTSEDGKSFYHKVGFIDGTLGENIFVIMTEGVAAEKGRTPYSQEMKFKEIEEGIIQKTL